MDTLELIRTVREVASCGSFSLPAAYPQRRPNSAALKAMLAFLDEQWLKE